MRAKRIGSKKLTNNTKISVGKISLNKETVSEMSLRLQGRPDKPSPTSTCAKKKRDFDFPTWNDGCSKGTTIWLFDTGWCGFWHGPNGNTTWA